MIFGCELKNIAKSDRRQNIDRAVEMAHLTDVRNRLIKNLSKGYRQRVGLAQAVLGFPPILILDEPTVGLDPKQIIEIRDLIRELSGEHTILLSSHILSEVQEVCDRVLILDRGRLLVNDTPENLRKHMMHAGELELLVKGDPDQIEKAVCTVANIVEYTLTVSDQGDCHKLTIRAQDECDVREALFYALAEHKCPILSLHTAGFTLEQIFLETTMQDDEFDDELSADEHDQFDESEDSDQ